MMIDWNKIRSDFPIAEKAVYFNSGAMSPIPAPVFKAIVDNYREIHEYGDVLWSSDLRKYHALCDEIASIINAEKGDVTFAPNLSTAMSLVALSVKNTFQDPYHVVSMEDEFPASTIGFEYLGIEMRYVKPEKARYPLESILELTDDKTAAVITSYIQYATGFRQDLVSLGQELKKRNILFIVNATQAFPYYPIDVEAMNIDVLTASLHKWGLTGHIGTIFFTSSSFRKKFPSPIAGWLSVDRQGGELIHTAKNVPFRLVESAHRYDFGTINFQPLLAFQVALAYLKNIGFQNIRLRILELTDYLIQGLKELDAEILSPISTPEERSAIVTFSLGARNREFPKELARKKIHVALRGGNIRVSINIFNGFTDIDRLLEALKEIIGRPAA